MNRTLIITGCIEPVKQNFLKILDVNERLEQYIESVEYYIKESLCEHIIFCENSDFKYDSSQLMELARENKKNFEWISFKGNQLLVQQRGKGIGEGEVIDYAISNSKFEIEQIEKVTGRLIIKNIQKIEKKLKSKTYINADVYIFNDGKSFDTRFYACSLDTYIKDISPSYRESNDRDNKNIERLLYKKLTNSKCTPGYPMFKGKSGGFGYEYEEKFFRTECLNILCKLGLYNHYTIRRIVRKLLYLINQ
mgnify:FL=1